MSDADKRTHAVTPFAPVKRGTYTNLLPIDSHDFRAILTAAQTRRATREALIASTPRPLTMPVCERGGSAATSAPLPSRLSLLVSLDPSKSRPGAPCWRVTRWEGDTPTGHVEAEDWGAAIAAADYAGGDLGAAKDAEVQP